MLVLLRCVCTLSKLSHQMPNTFKLGINYASCLVVVIKAHANGELKKFGSKLTLVSKVGL